MGDHPVSAIAEADEVHEIDTIFGPQGFTRPQGEALHPDREPLATLDRIRRTIGEYNFAGQYQQAPAPLGGGLVKAEWFKRYRPSEKPAHFDRIVQSWDTANKATELSDYSVCTTWGVKGKELFLLAVSRQRLEYPALKRAVREQQSLYNATVVLIEDKASGTQLIQELIADWLPRRHPVSADDRQGHAPASRRANTTTRRFRRPRFSTGTKNPARTTATLRGCVERLSVKIRRRTTASAFGFYSKANPVWDCRPFRIGISRCPRMEWSSCLPKMPIP